MRNHEKRLTTQGEGEEVDGVLKDALLDSASKCVCMSQRCLVANRDSHQLFYVVFLHSEHDTLMS